MKEIKNAKKTLLSFLDASPTAYHAVFECAKKLGNHGFIELKEESAWHIAPGGKYYVIRNGSSIAAFITPKNVPKKLCIAAAHTDSPTFKLKPDPFFVKDNMEMIGLEVYGSPLITSWLNRDLGIAGRILYTNKEGALQNALIHFDKAPCILAQLAVHLDRDVNDKGLILNKQEHLAALFGFTSLPKDNLFKMMLQVDEEIDVLSHDLFVYPIEGAATIGLNHEMIASYRLDNLASVSAILEGLLTNNEAANDCINMAVFWDNEEIGSSTAQGASSPFLMQTVERIMLSLKLSREDYFRIIAKSICASVDLAHSKHPNYSDKHEPSHKVLMSSGIVIKSHANCRYASDALSTAPIVAICKKEDIPYQHLVQRGDIPCGSTIGPLHATLSGMSTVDIGIAQLSMHSAREIIATADYSHLCRLIKHLFSSN